MIFFLVRDRSLHAFYPKCYLCQRRGKWAHSRLFSEIWHEFIVLATFFSYQFSQGDVHVSLVLFKSENLKIEVDRHLGKHP